MSAWAEDVAARLQSAFEPLRDESRAMAMARYMRHRSVFLGIPSGPRRAAQREALAGASKPGARDLAAALEALWSLPEREYQYAGCDLAARWVRVCGPDLLPAIEKLITTKSWWDTVDALAARSVGPLLAAHESLRPRPDAWIGSDDMWLRRTALIYQLGYRGQTDRDRLGRYCLARANEREFFIRKAIGWALREYSKTDPEWVRAFVAEHEAQLSGLSRREALLWLDGRRKLMRGRPKELNDRAVETGRPGSPPRSAGSA